MVIDKDKMRKLIQSYLQSTLEDNDTSRDVCESVWEKLFESEQLTDKEDEEVALLFDDIYQECIGKMIKSLKQ